MTEKVIPQLQAAAMEFLRYVYGVLNNKIPAAMVRARDQNAPAKFGKASHAGLGP